MYLTREEMIKYIEQNWDRRDEMTIVPSADKRYCSPAFEIDADYVRQCEMDRGEN